MFKRGFSLMEMMVVMLIVAIIAAATAPMINKKMIENASGESPWIWTTMNGDIAFNINGNESTAIIGAVKKPNGIKSKLHIKTKPEDPALTLQDEDNEPLKVASHNRSVFMTYGETKAEDSVGIGNVVVDDLSVSVGSKTNNKTCTSITNSVAVGAGAKSITNSVSIGCEADANDAAVSIGGSSIAPKNSIAIGFGAQIEPSSDGWGDSIPTANSVALGYGAKTNNNNSIALGALSNAKSKGSVAIGHNAIAEQSFLSTGGWIIEDSSTIASTIAIGQGAYSGMPYSIALGDNARTEKTSGAKARAISIGYHATTTKSDCIAIGGKYAGMKTEAIGTASTAIGTASYASGENSIAIGGTTEDLLSGENTGRRTKVTGKNSIAIGADAQVTHENSVAIGTGAKTTASNQIVLGTKDTTVYIPGKLIVAGETCLGTGKNSTYIYLTTYDGDLAGLQKLYRKSSGSVDVDKDIHKNTYLSNGAWNSDRRLKDVGEVFKAGLEEVKKLEVFNFTYKKDPNKTPRVGVMAQDLEKIFPKAVFKGDDGFLRIRMEDMFYAVVNAVKELDAKFTALVEEVKTAVADITDLKIKSAEYEKTIAELVEQNKAQAKALKDLEKRLAKLEKKAKKAGAINSEETVEE